jgi:hypothetical protein
MNEQDNDFVPLVDAADLKLAWQLCKNKNQDGKLGAVMGDVSPLPLTTNKGVFLQRFLMLFGLVEAALDSAHTRLAILRTEPIPDIVFQVIGEIPMTYEKNESGWPFDIEELMRRIGAAA